MLIEPETTSSSTPSTSKASKPMIMKNDSAAKPVVKTLRLPPPKPSKPQHLQHKMPAPPIFTPIQHKHALYKAYNTLPHSLHDLEGVEPIHVFRLFMNDTLFNTMAINTNLYAEKQ